MEEDKDKGHRIKPTYIDLRTDFGMKYVFQHENILRTLLNHVFARGHETFSIKHLKYENTEDLGISEDERRVIFDLLCTTDDGRKIIVEMQFAKQVNFQDRLLYYLSRMLSRQGIRGNSWQYQLDYVYLFTILDFVLDNDSTEYFHWVEFVDRATNKVFSEKAKLYVVELPKFQSKPVAEYDKLDKWIYAFCNLGNISERPEFMSEEEFDDLFSVSHFARMTKEEKNQYFITLDNKISMESALLKAKMEGKIEGKLEGIAEGEIRGMQKGDIKTALRLLSRNYPLEEIAIITDLTIEQIRRLNMGTSSIDLR